MAISVSLPHYSELQLFNQRHSKLPRSILNHFETSRDTLHLPEPFHTIPRTLSTSPHHLIVYCKYRTIPHYCALSRIIPLYSSPHIILPHHPMPLRAIRYNCRSTMQQHSAFSRTTPHHSASYRTIAQHAVPYTGPFCTNLNHSAPLRTNRCH